MAVNDDRAQSLEFRFQNEDLVVVRARQALLTGWGGFGRGHIYDAYGEPVSVMDGYWLIMFAYRGLLGLISLYLALLLAPTVALVRFAGRKWSFVDVAPAIALAVALVLFAIDTLLNAMLNAIYPLALGGLATVSFLPRTKLIEEPDVEESDEEEAPTVQRGLWPPPKGLLAPSAEAPTLPKP